MAELRFTSPPPRRELLEALREPLAEATPGVRWVAEGVLGAEAPIDCVGVEADGRAVVALLGEPGDDLALVSRGLAQRAWLEPRLADWAQLASHLGLRPAAGVRVLLLAPGFGPEARGAVAALGAAAPELVVYRCVLNGGGVVVLLDAERPSGPGARPQAALEEPSGFRTGLTDSDLGLSPDERREFE